MIEYLAMPLLKFRRNHIPVHTLPDFQANCNELPKHRYDNEVSVWITVICKIIYIAIQICSV